MERMKFRWATGLRVAALLMPLLGGKLVCAQVPPAEKPATTSAQIVKEIRIVKEDGSLLATNPTGISVKFGEALDRDEVAASIRALYQTGDYADLQAVVTPEGNGVRLD